MSDDTTGWRAARRVTVQATLLAALGMTTATAAPAETLADVVTAVATHSPVVAQGHARAEAAAASVRVERAAGRPQLSASATALQGTRGANAQAGFDRTLDTSLSLQFPIYSGGKVRNGIRAARARSAQAAAELDSTRAGAVADAIDAYLAVLRDRDALVLVENHVGLLDQVLTGARRQFDAGDGTRTDVAQARARLSLGHQRLEAARAAVQDSETRYAQLVGTRPGVLAAPPPLPAPPAETDAVATSALARSPAVAAADAALRAAQADTARAHADGRPQLSVEGAGQYHDYRQSYAGYPDENGSGARATVSASLPIYSGGRVRADIHRARAGEAEAVATREVAQRQATADIRRALIDYRAQVAMIALDEERIGASREALTGVQADHRAGDRTVLDVLNATLEQLDAETGLLNSRHDAYAAGVAVLKALNRLDCLAATGTDACAAAMAAW